MTDLTSGKMVNLNPTLSIIKLNVNDLIFQLTARLSDWIKKAGYNY